MGHDQVGPAAACLPAWQTLLACSAAQQRPAVLVCLAVKGQLNWAALYQDQGLQRASSCQGKVRVWCGSATTDDCGTMSIASTCSPHIADEQSLYS
jgi:hypothetical protein